MSKKRSGAEAKADLIARAMNGCVSRREMKRMSDTVGVEVPAEEYEAVYGKDRGGVLGEGGAQSLSRQSRYYMRKKYERLGVPVPDEFKAMRGVRRSGAATQSGGPVHDVSGQKTMRKVIEGFCTSRMASFIENWDLVKDPARKCDLYLKAAQFVLPRLASVGIGPDASMTSFAEELRAMAGEGLPPAADKRDVPGGPIIEVDGATVEDVDDAPVGDGGA